MLYPRSCERLEGFYLNAVSDKNICILWSLGCDISIKTKTVGHSPEDIRKNDPKCIKHSIYIYIEREKESQSSGLVVQSGEEKN